MEYWVLGKWECTGLPVESPFDCESCDRESFDRELRTERLVERLGAEWSHGRVIRKAILTKHEVNEKIAVMLSI